MWRLFLATAAALVLAGCQAGDIKVFIGATAIVAPGAQPIEDSVIIVAENKIRSVGMRKDIPIPQDSQRTDVTGKWIVPAEGARIAPGEPANFRVLDHAPN
ncbi:MAG: hypothetical protein M3N54_05040 [Acidobacteriota bacterium]|nr:hypothetical protein [Acidobacteriota bacterium]